MHSGKGFGVIGVLILMGIVLLLGGGYYAAMRMQGTTAIPDDQQLRYLAQEQQQATSTAITPVQSSVPSIPANPSATQEESTTTDTFTATVTNDSQQITQINVAASSTLQGNENYQTNE